MIKTATIAPIEVLTNTLITHVPVIGKLPLPAAKTCHSSIRLCLKKTLLKLHPANL